MLKSMTHGAIAILLVIVASGPMAQAGNRATVTEKFRQNDRGTARAAGKYLKKNPKAFEGRGLNKVKFDVITRSDGLPGHKTTPVKLPGVKVTGLGGSKEFDFPRYQIGGAGGIQVTLPRFLAAIIPVSQKGFETRLRRLNAEIDKSGVGKPKPSAE